MKKRVISAVVALIIFVPLVIYPFTFIVMNYFITEQKQIDFIIRMLLWGTVIVFVFGFLQAAFGIEKFSIPGLTVNYTDYLCTYNITYFYGW